MTFQRLFVITALCALLCVGAMGQTSVLPTYVGAGPAFNQIGTPRTNIWATAIYPVASSVGVYSSTTTDIIPVQKTDAATGRKYYAFTTSIRQGLHKTLYTTSKFAVLLGGDAGVGLSQADPSGVNVALSAAFTATAIYQWKPKWAIAVPIRGVFAAGAWNLIPEVGILFKP
jgi:hypothetical protein